MLPFSGICGSSQEELLLREAAFSAAANALAGGREHHYVDQGSMRDSMTFVATDSTSMEMRASAGQTQQQHVSLGTPAQLALAQRPQEHFLTMSTNGKK